MREWFDRSVGRVSGAYPSGWPVAAALLALAALGYTPAGESLFAPLDLLHWQFVARRDVGSDRGKVVTVVVDARTIAALGPSVAYARETHARLLDRLHAAASVNLDFTMVSPQAGDAELARAIARHGRVVLSAQSNAPSGRTDLVLAPSAVLANAAAAVGQRNLVLGSEHTVQGIVPFLKVGPSGFEEPHVAMQMLRIAGVRPPFGNLRQFVQAHVSSMGRVVPGALALSFPNDFDLHEYSYVDVLDGRVPESAFDGRIVFVGDTVTDLSGGPFRLSAKSAPLSRVQVDAQVADELLVGNVILRVPLLVQTVIGIGIAFGMILICSRASGRRLNVFALAWVGAVVAALTVLPVASRYWIPLGPALASCGVIYAVYGWRRAEKARRMLQREFDALRGSTLPFAVEPDLSGASGALHADEIGELMQRIRDSRTAYVHLIRSLPYPVFVEQGTKLVLSNEQGRELLDQLAGDGGEREGQPAVLLLARDEIRLAKMTREIRSAELMLGGRTHMMMVTPFGDGRDVGDAGSMICFVDVHDIKAAAESDRMTLRHMAHDLRNPLATMLTLLEERGAQGSGSDPGLIENLHRLVDYSLRVAQEFTQLSRAEHLDARTYVPLSAADLAAEAVDQVWHGAAARRIDVDGPHVSGDDAFVLGNRDMLLRALVNLLDNAIKYSPDDTRIDVRVEAGDDAVTIGIDDHGIGIPADALPHLFEPFFQVGGAGADPALGVGLGLPFVQAVVTRHGGTIDVASTPGEGSCFTVRLPITEAGEIDA